MIGVKIFRNSNGGVFITEMCGKYHGKSTTYYSNGTIDNRVWRHGVRIANK